MNVLVGPGMPGPALVGLAGLGLLISIFDIFKKNPGRGFKPVHVVALWAVLYFSFLAVQVKMVMDHYLLPVLPALAVLAAAPVGALARSQKLGRAARPLARAVFCGVVLWLAFFSVPAILDLHSRTWARELNKPTIEAGKWLAANYSPDCRVLSDAYGYIPASFKAGQITWRGNFEEAGRFKPDLIITTRAIEKRFQNPLEAKDYRFGKKAYLAAFEYYRALRSGDSNFKLIREFGPVRIYTAKNSNCGQ